MDAANTGSNNHERGRGYEELVSYIFGCIPGITINERDAMNTFQTEEVDIACWNIQSQKGLYFLNNIVLVECKNWSNPVGSEDVAYFITKVRHRGLPEGILVAANGITGDRADLTASHFELAMALRDGIRIMVLKTQELETLTHTDELIQLLQKKLLALVVRSTSEA